MGHFKTFASTLTWYTAIFFCLVENCHTQSAVLQLLNDPVREGDNNAVLSCTIYNPPVAEYHVIFARNLSHGGQDVIYMNDKVVEKWENKYYVYFRSQTEVTLTIWNIARDDTGKYLCQVVMYLGTPTYAINTVASGTKRLDVLYLPDPTMNPHCAVNNSPTYLQLDGTLQLQCLSETGNPSVDISWIQYEGDHIKLTPTLSTDGDTSLLTLNITLSPSYTCAVFTCVITSSAFPSFSNNCTVGPIFCPTRQPVAKESLERFTPGLTSGNLTNTSSSPFFSSATISTSTHAMNKESLAIETSQDLFNSVEVMKGLFFATFGLLILVTSACSIIIFILVQKLRRKKRKDRLTSIDSHARIITNEELVPDETISFESDDYPEPDMPEEQGIEFRNWRSRTAPVPAAAYETRIHSEYRHTYHEIPEENINMDFNRNNHYESLKRDMAQPSEVEDYENVENVQSPV